MSDKQTHTPGPWEIFGKDETPEGFEVLEISAGDCPGPKFKSIAYVHGTSEPPDFDGAKITAEDEANAHLIAAAPALLEALETVAATLELPHAKDAANTVVAGHAGPNQVTLRGTVETALAAARPVREGE